MGAMLYAGYMANQQLTADPETYKPLLKLIGEVESNNNYNAHFGNASNTSIRFTDMTIAEVLAWQDTFVASGKPSSAVGRYQIINSTLRGLVEELRLDTSRKFDEQTQDLMAATLLKRRGVNQYVNNELSDQQFAANLAREWAALPRVLGDKPEASYYESDGLNVSRVKPDVVLQTIQLINAS